MDSVEYQKLEKQAKITMYYCIFVAMGLLVFCVVLLSQNHHKTELILLANILLPISWLAKNQLALIKVIKSNQD